MISGRPLNPFPLVNTSNLDEALAARSRIYAAPKFELVTRQKTFRAIVNLCKLRHTRISYGSYSAGLHMWFPETSFATHIFLLRGKSEAMLGQRSEMIAGDRGLVISPHEAFSVTHNCDYDRLVLSVNSNSLANVLSAITGTNCCKPLKFNPVQDYAVPGARALRDHFLFLVEKLTVSAAPFPKPVLEEFEQTLMMMFLHANRHNYSHLLERAAPTAALAQMRRAEEYIEANGDQAIGLPELTEVAGVSALSLFRTFKSHRGYSPFAFVSQVRVARKGLLH